MSDIKIKIEADISQVPEKLKTVQSELGKTAISAQKSDSSLGKLGAGFTNIASKSGVASSALSSLASTASGAAGELSSLGSSLLTGGLIAAIPVIITLVQSLGEALFGLSAQQKALNQTVENSVSGFVKANTEVSNMTQKIELAKKGFADKDKVVQEFNNTLGKSIGFVTDIKQAEAALISKGPAYIKMMTLKAAANYATAQSGELLAKSILISVQASSGFVGRSIDALSAKVKKQSDTFKDFASVANKVAQDVASDAGVNFVDAETITEPFKKAKEKIHAHIRSISDVLADLKNQMGFLAFLEINFNTDEANAKLSALNSALRELVTKFGKGASDEVVIDLIVQIKNIKFEQGLDKLGGLFAGLDIEKILAEDLRKPIDVDITVQPHVKFLEAENLKEEGEKFRQAVQTEVELTTITIGAAIDALNAAATAAGQGKNPFGAFFGVLLKSLGSGISSLGKYLITSNVAIQAAQKSLGKLSGIGTAIALVAIGALIQFASARIQQSSFASGVRSFSGGYALVGERGPERVFLPQGSSVQPNNELNAFSGSNRGFIAETRISGQDLVIALRRAENTMSRNN